MNRFVYSLLFLAVLSACRPGLPSADDTELPILGLREALRDGEAVLDTIRIPPFRLMDQDSNVVDISTVQGKVFVADFFFTTCPSICPLMSKQMFRVYERFKDNPDVLLLSHSIDPMHDTVLVLRNYAGAMGVKGASWRFLTGNQDSIFTLAEKFYMVNALIDANSPGGYAHSGHFVLVDKDRRIRGYYDGTTEEGADKLMRDMDRLLRSYAR